MTAVAPAHTVAKHPHVIAALATAKQQADKRTNLVRFFLLMVKNEWQLRA
jgi:hypothetical protein